MTNPVARLVTTRMYGDDSVKWRTIYIWCPGCDSIKGIPIPGEDGTLPTDGRDYWTFDGNLEQPTLSPSILQHASRNNRPNCHSFLRAGHWEFLSDSTHALAGQTVDMVPLPDWVMGEK